MSGLPSYEESFSRQTLNAWIDSNIFDLRITINIPSQSFDKLSETYSKLYKNSNKLCFLEDSADIPEKLPKLVILYKDLCASKDGQVIYPHFNSDLTPKEKLLKFKSLSEKLINFLQTVQDEYFSYNYG